MRHLKQKHHSINPTTFVDYSAKTIHTQILLIVMTVTKYSAIDKEISDQFKIIAKVHKSI